MITTLGVVSCRDDDETGTDTAGEAGSVSAGTSNQEPIGGADAVGSGGAGGAADNAGAGGTGTGATGGDGLAGAGAGRPFSVMDCADQPVELDPNWVRYCTVLSSCLGQDISWCLSGAGQSYSFYFSSPNLPLRADAPEPAHGYFELSACSKQIETCDDVLNCAGFRLPIDECETDQAARCEGDVAVNCGQSGMVSDCERLTGNQSSCQVLGAGDDARAVCLVEPGCDAPDTEACVGDKVVKCHAGNVAEGRDCAELGLKCRESDGSARCAPPTPTETCEEPGYASCDGDSITYCGDGGVLYRSASCSVAGDLVCGSPGADNVDDHWWDCIPRGCDNAWSGNTPSCDGADYVFETGYWTVRVHCRTTGSRDANTDAAPTERAARSESPFAHGVTMLAALAARAIEVRAAGEEAGAVLAGHVRRAIEVLFALERAHPAAAVSALATDAAEAVHIGATDAADAARASGRIETTDRAPIGVVVIVATTGSAERAHDDPCLDRNASNP